MEQRISLITLGVSDLKRARSFYEHLGWTVATEEHAENIVAFNLQSFVLALYPKEGLADDVGIEMRTSANPSFTLAYNVGSVEEVDQIMDTIQAIGAEIIREAQHVFWGGYSGYFSDPDGYLWEVAFNPYSVPDENGTFQWG